MAPTHVAASDHLSLERAMRAAYADNASLQAERFKTRVADDEVAKAKSGYRPNIYGSAGIGGASTKEDGRKRGFRPAYSYGLTVEQPLFDGFQTQNSVRSAEAGVRSSRAGLAASENEILFATASAYLDVLRDEGRVLYRRKSLTKLKRILVGVRDRYEKKQSTSTDVSQTQARLARASADLDEAIGQLRISALRFQEVTRLDARGFRMPRLPSSHLPKTLKVAKARARRNSPVLAASRFRLAGARADAKTVRGAFLPQASVVANYERYESDDQLVSETDDASVFAKVRVPLYQQGKTSAQYRQAINTISQRQREAEAASHKIGRAVGEAWVSYRSAQSRVAARQRAVTASERAFRGLQEEHRLGTRSILDVLDAERDLIDARIALLETKRDAHVGAYLVLRSTGELTLAKFAPGADRYAPEEHYAKVKNKVWGTLPTGAANSRFLGGDPEDGGSVARFAKSAPRLGARPRDDRGGWSATVTRSTNRDGR